MRLYLHQSYGAVILSIFSWQVVLHKSLKVYSATAYLFDSLAFHTIGSFLAKSNQRVALGKVA